MTIRRILQVSVPVVAAVSLLGACAADTTKVATKAPATIRVGARSASGGEKVAASAAGMADASVRMRPVNYVLGEGLVAPAGPRTAWVFPASSAAATDAQKEILAKAFGLSGTWKTLPKDQGGYDFLGDSSKGEASLTITTDALRSWWYSPSWSNTTVTVACAEPGIAVGEPAPSDASAPADTSVPTTITEPELRPCEAPKPPANVPNKAEAEAKAKALLEQIGLDPNNYVLETYADEWGAYLTGWLLVDGQRTQMAVGFGFGAEGALTSASGFLAVPQRGDQYELVTIDQAVKRLNDTNGYWTGYYGGPMGIAARGMAIDSVATDAVATVAGSVTSGGGSAGAVSTDPGLAPEAVPTETAPTETATVETAPVAVETVPAVTEPGPEVMTITLTGVTVGLAQLWDADGNVWLIPSYVFTSADGGQFSVYAIADQFLDFAALTDPVPVDGVGVDPAVTTGVVEEPTPTVVAPVDTAATKEN